MPITNAVKSNTSFPWSSMTNRLNGRNIMIIGLCAIGVVVATKLIWDHFKKQSANQQRDLVKFFFPMSKLLPSSINDVEILSGLSIPSDIWRRICAFLPAKAIFSLSQTCKALVGLRTDTQVLPILWKNHRNDLENVVFGKVAWNTHFGDVGEVDPIPEALIKALEEPCPFTKGKKVKDTHIACWIPEKVNDINLDINFLGELVKKPLKGHASKYDFIWSQVVADHGATPIKKGHWILLTKTIINGSQDETYDQQKKLVERYPGYEVPTLLPTAIALFMHHARTGERLYNNKPLMTYTRCQEKSYGCPLVVGGFAAGLDIDDTSRHRLYGTVIIGVGGLRNF